MATADDYAQWIVNNADKRGTPEFATVAAAYQDAKRSQQVQPTQPAAIEKKGFLQSLLENFGKAGQGSTPEEAQQTAQQYLNLTAGGVKGAGDIGATLINPLDSEARKQRKENIQAGLESLGAQPESPLYTAGKIVTQIAGTAGVGGALAKPVLATGAPALAKIGTALGSGGLRLGGAPAETLAAQLGNAATRIGAGAAVGAGSAGLIEPEDMKTGAIIGGAIPGVAKLGAGIGSALKAGIYDPLVNRGNLIAAALLRAVGPDKADDVIRALSTTAQTPGVRLSAGQASQNETLAAIEDALKATNAGGALSTQASANRQALADALRNIGQDETALQAAKVARASTTGPMYQQAISQTVQPTKEILDKSAELFARPSIKQAMNDAVTLAQEQGVKLDNATSMAGLHYTKLALDKQIGAAKMAGDNNMVSALQGTKEKLLNLLDEVSPGYREASQKFAEMSRPINQMQIGQKAANLLIPATSGDIPATLNAATLAKALRNPDILAQQATGFKGATMAGIMTPEQLATIQGASSDAARIAEAAKLGQGAGSATARRLATTDFIGQNFAERAPFISKVFNAIGLVPGVNIATKGAGAMGSMVGKGINQKAAAELEDMMANNPQQVAAIIKQELSRMPAEEQATVLKYIPKSLLVTAPAAMSAQ